MPYDDLMVAPMREELTRLGVEELRDAADVSRWMDDHTGSALLFFNSVCGCAAGMARPGLALALQNAHRPNRVATVFAGQDMEATAAARKAIAEVPPSSPSATPTSRAPTSATALTGRAPPAATGRTRRACRRRG